MVPPTTDNQPLIDQLDHLISTESHSLSRHLESATPYLSPSTYQKWEQIQHALHLSHEHEKRLTQLIAALRAPASPGVFQAVVANYHDMDVETMIPQLVNEKQHLAAAYQQAIELAGEQPSIVAELQAILDEVNDQIRQLKDQDG